MKFGSPLDSVAARGRQTYQPANPAFSYSSLSVRGEGRKYRVCNSSTLLLLLALGWLFGYDRNGTKQFVKRPKAGCYAAQGSLSRGISQSVSSTHVQILQYYRNY